jgi:hypothetical protein
MARTSAAMQASLDRMGAPRQTINSGVRTDAEQAALFRQNYTSDYSRSSKRDKRVWNGVTYWRKAPYDKHVMVAVPGTSNHEEPPGTAMDVDTDSPLHAHLLKHGAQHGWSRPLLAFGEPWHWEYNANKDRHLPRATREAVDKLTGAAMRAVATTSGRRFVLGELTYQDMSQHWDHASHEAKIWNPDTGQEPVVIPDETLDLAIGQIQKRRAQFAEALKQLGV